MMTYEMPPNAWPPRYTIKRHRRAKNVKLRTSESYGLEITVPHRFNIKNIPSILEENKIWLEKQLAKVAVSMPQPLPEVIELKAVSRIWKMIYVNKSEAKIKLIQRHQLNELVLYGHIDDKHICKMKMKVWLKNQAKKDLPALLDEVSNMMQIPYSKVTIRSQKTLWGSCTIDKSINLNYKLLFLPAHLVKHVLIHELSHIIHHNHSDQFWHLVADYDKEWKSNRRELKSADTFLPQWLNR